MSLALQAIDEQEECKDWKFESLSLGDERNVKSRDFQRQQIDHISALGKQNQGAAARGPRYHTIGKLSSLREATLFCKCRMFLPALLVQYLTSVARGRCHRWVSRCCRVNSERQSLPVRYCRFTRSYLQSPLCSTPNYDAHDGP